MKTVIDAVNEFKGLGLSAVVGDKYLSSDGVTEKTINTYVHLFAYHKEQLNDWSRVYTEFVWRINTGEKPNFTGDVEWSGVGEAVHKTSMKTLCWDLDIVKWRPVLKSTPALKSQPVFTQAMDDNRELPQVGMKVELNTEFNGFNKGSILSVYSHDVSSNDNCVLAGGIIKGVSGGVQAFEFHIKYLSPIDTRTDKEKAIDSIYDDLYANKVIHSTVRDGRDDDLISSTLSIAYDKWVGE